MQTDRDRDRENILSDFAMEMGLTANVLRAYIQRYPKLALELTDLFHELTMVDLANAVGTTLGEEEPEGKELEEGVAMVRTALFWTGPARLGTPTGTAQRFCCGVSGCEGSFGVGSLRRASQSGACYRCEDAILYRLLSTAIWGHWCGGVQSRCQAARTVGVGV